MLKHERERCCVTKVVRVGMESVVAERAGCCQGRSAKRGVQFIGREWSYSIPGWDPPFWVGDRQFTAADLEPIGWTARHLPGLTRWERR